MADRRLQTAAEGQRSLPPGGRWQPTIFLLPPTVFPLLSQSTSIGFVISEERHAEERQQIDIV